MAEAIFFLKREFGHRLFQAANEEDRIVAKAARPALGGQDLARAFTPTQLDRTRWTRQGYSAAEARPPGPRFPGQIGQQPGAPVSVAGAGSAVSRRVQARRPSQRFNLQSGVITQDPFSTLTSQNLYLQDRIFRVAAACFFYLLSQPEFVHGENFDWPISQESPDFT